jgi:hypothetical protein
MRLRICRQKSTLSLVEHLDRFVGFMQSGGFGLSAIAQPWTFARTQAATERLMQMVGAKTMDDLRKVPTGVLRNASQALCGVSGGEIHKPADLMWVSVPWKAMVDSYISSFSALIDFTKSAADAPSSDSP